MGFFTLAESFVASIGNVISSILSKYGLASPSAIVESTLQLTLALQ